MASNTREKRIIEAVPCPRCGAKIGELCRIDPRSRQASPGRPILHQERRNAWMDWKRAREAAG